MSEFLKELMNRDLETVLIDVTEQPVERPKQRQQDYFSDKKSVISNISTGDVKFSESHLDWTPEITAAHLTICYLAVVEEDLETLKDLGFFQDFA